MDIQKYRKLKNLTQKELGDKIGVSRNAIARYESGEITPKTDKLALLSEVLDHDFISDYLSELDDSIAEQVKTSIEAVQVAKELYQQAEAFLDEVDAMQDLSKMLIPSCIEGMGYSSWTFEPSSLKWGICTEEGITKYADNDQVVNLFNHYLEHLKMDFEKLFTDEEGESNGTEK